MAKYLIKHRIKTMAKCETPFDFEGIHFEHYEFNLRDGWLTDYWLATKEVEAKSWHEAANTFRGKLRLILPKIAFISQCALEFLLEPFFVLNLDYKEKIIFINHTKDVEGVGLHFGENEIECLKALDKSNIGSGFYDFMVDSTNASTLHTSLYMIFSALENLAQGKRTMKCENCKYEKQIDGVDPELLKIILGNEVYNQCWGPSGLRHKMSHGEFPNVPQGLKEEIYKKIISFLNEKNKISINEKVVGPQRSFTGNKHQGINFYKYFGEGRGLNLKDFCEILDKNLLGEEGRLEHVGADQYKITY
jgi:hypothetical protein